MVKLKLISWTNKLAAIKFVMAIKGTNIIDTRSIVEGTLPVELKEYSSFSDAQQAIDNHFAAHQNDLTKLVYSIEVNSLHIDNTANALVTGNPNNIPSLQSNHKFSTVQNQEGDTRWRFFPNNPAGQKWVIDKDIIKSKIESQLLDKIYINNLNIPANGFIKINSNLLPPANLDLAGQIRRSTKITGVTGQNSDKLSMCIYNGGNTAEWVTIIERTW